MPATSGRQTFWHVIEIADSLKPTECHSFTVPNEAPHLLRWIAEPHLATHRVVGAQRRHAGSGASAVRLVLESRSEPERQIILHTLLISLTTAS